jgi:hypothetical protein
MQTFPSYVPEVPQMIWAEYYRLRNWARLSLVSLPAALFMSIRMPEPILLMLNALPLDSQLAIIFVIIGLGAVFFSMPVLKWADWRCPRCGEKFVQRKIYFGFLALTPLVWRLVFNSSCPTCKLRCGAPMISADHW